MVVGLLSGGPTLTGSLDISTGGTRVVSVSGHSGWEEVTADVDVDSPSWRR